MKVEVEVEVGNIASALKKCKILKDRTVLTFYFTLISIVACCAMAQITTGVVRTISTILAWIRCTFISSCGKEEKERMQTLKTNLVKLPFRRICNCRMYVAQSLIMILWVVLQKCPLPTYQRITYIKTRVHWYFLKEAPYCFYFC